MSNNLTSTQADYLLWMKDGNKIGFCTEVCGHLGEIVYSSIPLFKKNRRAIYYLLRKGYLNTIDSFPYGIRWTELSISQKGLALLDGHDD